MVSEILVSVCSLQTYVIVLTGQCCIELRDEDDESFWLASAVNSVKKIKVPWIFDLALGPELDVKLWGADLEENLRVYPISLPLLGLPSETPLSVPPAPLTRNFLKFRQDSSLSLWFSQRSPRPLR